MPAADPTPPPAPPPAPPATPWQLLRRRADTDGARPVLTYRDEATDERVELSGVTLDNWVAKTANLLQEELGAGPGSVVSVRVPPHWQSAVWVLAAWAVGAVVRTGPGPAADVAVTGPDGIVAALDDGADDGAGEVVALSLRPLGMPFAEPLPPSVRDYAVEARGMGDRFTPWQPVGPDAAALVDGSQTLDQATLVRQAEQLAAERGIGPADRVVVDADPASPAGAVQAVLLPLVSGASVVLVRTADPAADERRAREERLTVDLTG